ncbi:plasmid and phage replicative helicase [Rhizobiales bacterium GAS113]|nr:plasmid and phage replicative helicase [Rhizobiales bacterium GAS113]
MQDDDPLGLAKLGPLPRERDGSRAPDELATVRAITSTVAKPITASPYIWRDPARIPRREWLYGRHFIRKFLSCTIALPGVGKSNLEVAEAVAMASGRNLLGVPVAEPLRVWYWNGEDPLEEIERRIAAICLHYGLTEDDLAGRLFINSGRDTKIVIAVSTTKDGTTIAAPVVAEIVAAVQENQIDVVMLDPFASSHAVTENDNVAIGIVARAWSEIADKCRCAFELVHHSRKAGGSEVTVEHGRGAVALLAAARSARVLNTMTKEEGEKAGVTTHRLYFRLENGKANLAPPPERADWFHLHSVALGNGDPIDPLDDGDHVAVVTNWDWPDAFEGVTVAHLREVQRRVGDGEWREAVQSKTKWVGVPIADALSLDVANKAARAKISGLIKTWIDSGMLVKVRRKDENRVERTFVEVGELATD